MGSNESYLVMEFMLIDDMILSMLHNKPRLWRLNKIKAVLLVKELEIGAIDIYYYYKALL